MFRKANVATAIVLVAAVGGAARRSQTRWQADLSGYRAAMPVGSEGQVCERAPARPESVGPLRRAVVAYAARCGVSQRQCEDVALAVSEALTNAVVHGYAGHDEPGVVVVEAWIDARSLHVVVCDEGDGVRLRSDSPGMGLGLALIRRVTERLRVEDVLPGARLRMTFALG